MNIYGLALFTRREVLYYYNEGIIKARLVYALCVCACVRFSKACGVKNHICEEDWI